MSIGDVMPPGEWESFLLTYKYGQVKEQRRAAEERVRAHDAALRARVAELQRQLDTIEGWATDAPGETPTQTQDGWSTALWAVMAMTASLTGDAPWTCAACGFDNEGCACVSEVRDEPV